MNKLLKFLGIRVPDEPVQALEPGPEAPAVDLEIYNGLRVEVTTMDDRLLFVATLLGLHQDQGTLFQTSEAAIAPKEEGIPVKIRGYSNRQARAVYLEGNMMPGKKDEWPVEGLTLVRTANDRAFFRQETDAEVLITPVGRIGAQQETGKMVNISVGGACIRLKGQHHPGDKFLLKVRLHDEQGEMVFVCEVRRAIEKDGGWYEYGCRFVQLSENEQNRIAQSIYDLQRQKRFSA